MATATEIKEYIEKAHKPFDCVILEDGSVGFIKEVSINDCQESFDRCVSYSIHWIENRGYNKTAWFSHKELEGNIYNNFMFEVAKCMVHPFGNNEKYVDRLFGV